MRRVVSLVPSLTEAVAASGATVVGATDWCPSWVDAPRVGGTKNPSVAAVLELGPDLVVANEEENRASDLAALRAGGLEVWVTHIRSLPEAFAELASLIQDGCGLALPPWLADAERAWRAVGQPRARRRAAVPIWRRPWMVLGRDTFAGSVLEHLGVDNVFAGHPERYPRVTPADTAGAELIVLPDEPYPFSATDGPEAFPDQQVRLVSGRHLTWYGPSLVEAPSVLLAQLA